MSEEELPRPEAASNIKEKLNCKSLKTAMDNAKWNHSIQCQGEGLVSIGLENEFFDDFDEDDHRDYWIQNGEIFAIIKCPKEPHERVARFLENLARETINRTIGQTVVDSTGSATRLVRNFLAFHSLFEKEPDGSIMIRPRWNGSQRMPVIVVEVASSHETYHLLMCEIAAWFASPLDVQYAIAAKIKKTKTDCSVEIFLFKNVSKIVSLEEKESKLIQMSNELSNQKMSRKNLSLTIEDLPRKRFCEQIGPVNFHSSEDLFNNYKLTLIKSFLLNKSLEDLDKAHFSINLAHIFREADYDGDLDLEETECWIDLSDELANFFDTLSLDGSD